MRAVSSNSYSENILLVLEKEDKGKLHSLFETSINLKFGERLINISCNNTVMPPFGIQVPEYCIKKITADIENREEIIFDSTEKSLLFKDMDLKLNLRGKIYDSRILPVQADKKNAEKNIKEILDYFLGNNEKNGFGIGNREFVKVITDVENSTLNEEVLVKINNIRKDIEAGKTEIKSYNYFLGRGEGLTPGGDDFIIGIMAAMNFFNHKKTGKLKKELMQDIYKKTTDISAEYLYYGVISCFSLNITEFCKKLLLNNINKEEEKKTLYKSYENLIKNGHTSGVDTLMGILLYIITALKTV